MKTFYRLTDMSKAKTILLCSFLCAVTIVPCYGQTHPSLDSTIICGYQGWFACSGDNSPMGGWFHWNGGQPSPGHQSFEVYPDIVEYSSADLFQTGYAALGDGRPAKLFSAYKQETSDLHCKWMQDNGIDGVALQRFTPSGNYKSYSDSVAVHLMHSAEKYNRMFYIMYDGIGDNMAGLEADWQNTIVNGLKITSSPRYAYENGKPVVCFWGFGLTSYSDNATDALAAVTWFKNHGCYVIGGVPTNWRTGTSDAKPGYAQVYAAMDMISPWTVGRYKSDADVDNYKTNYLVPDKAKLDGQGIAYQPVMFPGFAWSNWNGGAPNDFPRRQGKFMWRQFNNIKSLGIKFVYVAMFDEYDEGTAITKAAADYFDVPTNQYFQTLSIDGVYLSSDFYLRLVGAATKVLKGTMAITPGVPIPNSMGPIYFRSSFEPVDAQLTWVSTSDTVSGGFQNVAGPAGTGNPTCIVASGSGLSGSHCVQYSGKTTSTGSAAAFFKAVDVDIPVVTGTTLSYAINPSSDLSRYAGIDLVMTDGTTLHSTAATDTAGLNMSPAVARGTVNQWTTIKCPIGNWLAGKTIDRILVGFSHSGLVGQFMGSLDNLVIRADNATNVAGTEQPKSFHNHAQSISVLYAGGALTIVGFEKGSHPTLLADVYGISGKRIARLTGSAASIPISLPKGIYIVRMQDNAGRSWMSRISVMK